METFDFIIIGGGIVGLSTAWQLQQKLPTKSIAVLEKETAVAQHQTGHNSGVIHAGVYYKPGTLKSEFCREGNKATVAFCQQHDIPYEQCGKLLVATNDLELQRMQGLIGRCAENDLPIEVLDAQQLKEREPNIAGVGAIFVSSSGIVDYGKITEKMAELFVQAGGKLFLDTEVTGISEKSDTVSLETNRAGFTADYVLMCPGLHADRMVRMMGIDPDFKIIPFRGEYYLLKPEHNQIVNHLIYPIPDPELPFLGVHLTRMIDGTVTVGPNAVLAFAREGYRKSHVSIRDMLNMLSYPGLWKLLKNNFRSGMSEMKNSFFKNGYLKLVQKYCPQLVATDLQPYPAGVRAQAVNKQGEMVDDFLFMNTDRVLAVCNAPSPAATSAIPIGNHIVGKMTENFNLAD